MKSPSELREKLGERRYDLDWVRIGAFMLLIFYHVGMYYVSWDWHVKSSHASAAIEPLLMLTSPWRLTLLFLVSGVATAYLLERQGKNGFLRQRSIRLLVPLLFGMAIIVPPQSYLEVVEKLAYPGTYLEFWSLYITGFHGFCRGSNCLVLPTWNHLWFVAYLWVYTAILRAASRLLPGSIPRLRGLVNQLLTGWGLLAWPIAFYAIARVTLIGHFPPNHAMLNDWYNHAVYGVTFLLGFALAGATQPWISMERARWLALGAAIPSWAALSGYLGAYDPPSAPSPPEALRVIMQVTYAAQEWLAIVAVLGFARRHLSRDNAARRYLTAAIFPVYILHQTVIVVLAHSLKPANLNPVVEGLILVLATGSLCFLAYEAIRRTRLLRPLFGVPTVLVRAYDSSASAPSARGMHGI